MARLKGFVSSIWSFVCLVSVVGSGIIVVAVLMTSTANATTITGLAPDPLYLLPNTSGELILTISEPADPGGWTVALSSSPISFITVPANVVVPAGDNMAPITVTSTGQLGDAWVWASHGDSIAGARIIITEDIPSVPIPGAVWLLGTGLAGLSLAGWRRRRS